MDFSPEIKEDAWLNYAKLSYEIGNSYQSVPEVLLSFIDQYPKNKNSDEIKELLFDSYITSKNYKPAIALLEYNRSFQNKSVYQKVAFYRAVELYFEGNYQEAILYFTKSLKEPHDAIFTARATYWNAECEYLLSNFERSLKGYKQYLQLPSASETPEYANSTYNLAYNEFKLKNYSAAITYFRSYATSSEAKIDQKKDAYLRLGDSYFVTSKYGPALENYTKAIDLGTPDADYAQFQKAISYGFVDRSEQKIKGLLSFVNSYRSSLYLDDALYELGNTYVSQGKNGDAISTYNRLIRELPSSKVSMALYLDTFVRGR